MMGAVNGLMTLLLIILFLGIWAWAWSSKNKSKFDRMAHLPLEENSSSHSSGEDNHDD